MRATICYGLVIAALTFVGASFAQAPFSIPNAGAMISALKPLADAGDPTAENDLGVVYEIAAGPQNNPVRAAEMYRKGAVIGLPAAQYNLSRLLSEGRGTRRNQLEAVDWLKRSAASGYGPAQHKLADWYAAGDGVPKNMEEAVRLFRLLAAKGDMQAQYYLGLSSAGGIGAPKDLVEAYKWFTVAASGPMPPAVATAEFLRARGDVAGKMTPGEVAEAERRASTWSPTSLEDRFVSSGYRGPGSPTRPFESPALRRQ